MRIEQLSSAQESKLAVYRDKWLRIGLSTGPCDRAAVAAAIDEVYRYGGREPPKIKIWLDSPHAGVIAAMMLSQVWSQVGSQVESQVRSQVESQVWSQVGSQVESQVRSQVESQVYNCGYGTHDANWLAFYEFFAVECGLAGQTEKLRGLLQLAEAGCGWWWPFEGAVILTERPTLLRRDEEHRLHCEDGPALAYADGFAIHAWHGVRVPSEIIEHPELIQPEKVLTEDNQEVRRIMLERYGWVRLLRDLGAAEVHRDSCGVLYETARLGEYLDGEDAVARFVHVVDPSTGREYALRVPPIMTTAQAAVAWTFHIEDNDAAQYAPQMEA
jgi:hypothetical protein